MAAIPLATQLSTGYLHIAGDSPESSLLVANVYDASSLSMGECSLQLRLLAEGFFMSFSTK